MKYRKHLSKKLPEMKDTIYTLSDEDLQKIIIETQQETQKKKAPKRMTRSEQTKMEKEKPQEMHSEQSPSEELPKKK